MRIDILTVVPDLLKSPFAHSILQRAKDKGLLEIVVHNLRDFSTNKHRQVDDYPFGGGAGMVMQIEPIDRAYAFLRAQRDYDEFIYMTPDGQRLEQRTCNRLSLKNNLILLCGHYKGVDERVREHFATMELSIGDYVLSGGELPAAVLVDSIGRLLPGVLGDESSALTDSFQDKLLAPPIYTRPAQYKGWEVPAVLRSGHLRKIEQWREEQAYKRTQERRPDLLKDEKEDF